MTASIQTDREVRIVATNGTDESMAFVLNNDIDSQRASTYYEKHKPAMLEYSHNYYARNRQTILAKKKIYNNKNKEQIKEYRKKYWLAKKELLKLQRREKKKMV
jgi:hypothetical protein